MKFKLLLIAVAFLPFASCNKDEKQAHRSLEGTWNVIAIESNYGEFSETGTVIDSTVYEQGDLGTFHFGKEMVDFEFTGNDTFYHGSSTWQLDVEKVNEGFVRISQFTLSIENEFDFSIQFKDATKNAEKNAEDAIFSQVPNRSTHVQIVLWLEKV